MKKILIINYSQQKCGIYQYGYNFYNTIKKNTTHIIEYIEINNYDEFLKKVTEVNFDIFIFNWLSIKMSWLSDNILNSFHNIKKFFIFHDFSYPPFKSEHYILHQDPTRKIIKENEFIIGRFLYDFNFEKKIDNDKIIISSFGFAFFDKGFDKVVDVVNREFSNATIRLHLPYNTVVDADKYMKKEIIKKCELLNTKNNLIITEDYMSNEDLLIWLSQSSINCFFYDNKPSLGISSVIDYALSVKVPLAITDCEMFRHIKKEEILIEKNTLKSIIDQGNKPLIEFQKNWNPINFTNNFDKVMSLH
jgi:hypothetical protein